MANISPDTPISALPPGMTLGELADEMRANGIGFGRSYSAEEYGGGTIGKIAESIKIAVDAIKKMDSEIMGLLDPWQKADAAVSKYARSIGASQKAMMALRHEAIQSAVKGGIGLDFGMNVEDLIEAQTNYMKGIGRNVKLAADEQRSLAAITSVFGDQTEMFDAFDKMGVTMDGTAKHMGKMFAEAAKSGISLDKYAQNVKQGLATANRFTFRDGIKGMEAMAKRAAAIRMDMQQVEAFAGNFGDIDTAISNSAKLQVLGGNFARGADPLGILNDSLSDLESLQKRMEGFTEGMAHFNRATGEVDIDRMSMWKLKEYAKITGQDQSKVVEVARRQAMRGEIESQLKSSSNYNTLSEDFKELIKNTATFKDGKAGVTINGEFKEISQLQEKDREKLLAETQDQSQDIKQIAKDVRSLADIRTGFKKEKESVQAQMTNWLGSAYKGTAETVSGWKTAVHGVLRTISVGLIAGTGLKIFGLAKGAVKSITSLWTGGITSSFNAITNTAKGAFNSIPTSFNAIKNSFKNVPESLNAIRNGARAAKDVNNIRSASRFAKTARKAKQIKNLVKAGKGAKVLSAGLKATTKAIPIVGGLLSAGIEAINNKDQFKDKTTRGKAIGKTVGAGAGAVIGGALMSWAGPVGMAIGSMAGEWVGKHVGGWIGGIQDKRVAKNQKIVDAQLESAGIQRQGDYGVRKLKQIDKALQTGEMSNSLRRKLIKEGDIDLVKQIDNIYDTDRAKQKRAEKAEKKAKFRTHVNSAVINVDRATFNGPDIKIRGKKETGAKEKFKKSGFETKEVGKDIQQIGPQELNVNIAGTIDLKGPNGDKFDILAEIKSNPILRNELTKIIINNWNTMQHGGMVETRPFGVSAPQQV